MMNSASSQCSPLVGVEPGRDRQCEGENIVVRRIAGPGCRPKMWRVVAAALPVTWTLACWSSHAPTTRAAALAPASSRSPQGPIQDAHGTLGDPPWVLVPTQVACAWQGQWDLTEGASDVTPGGPPHSPRAAAGRTYAAGDVGRVV